MQCAAHTLCYFQAKYVKLRKHTCCIPPHRIHPLQIPHDFLEGFGDDEDAQNLIHIHYVGHCRVHPHRGERVFGQVDAFGEHGKRWIDGPILKVFS